MLVLGPPGRGCVAGQRQPLPGAICCAGLGGAWKSLSCELRLAAAGAGFGTA